MNALSKRDCVVRNVSRVTVFNGSVGIIKLKLGEHLSSVAHSFYCIKLVYKGDLATRIKCMTDNFGADCTCSIKDVKHWIHRSSTDRNILQWSMSHVFKDWF